jgi:membrane-bound serine protease (ClpP class)
MEVVIALLVVGTVLLILETVLPGLIAGILGMLCLIGGLVAGYQNFGLRTGNFILTGVALGLIAGISVWFRYFPNSRIAQVFISQRTVGDIGTEKPELLHKTGAAMTQLRPCGTAIFDGQRVDVVTEGGLVERGTPVQVIALEGMRVVVRAIEKNSTN